MFEHIGLFLFVAVVCWLAGFGCGVRVERNRN